MIRSLENQGIQRLYPQNYSKRRHPESANFKSSFYFFVMFSSVDKRAELKKLNRSILICFLELLDILINNPASPAVGC